MIRVIAAKEQQNGVFWLIDDEDILLAYPFGSVDSYDGIAKSGNTYNHKRLWSDIKPRGIKRPYNYYPRGRVEWDNQGRATIFMNSNIDDEWVNDIKQQFGVRPSDECRIQYDNSNHYKCHLDDGWTPDR